MRKITLTVGNSYSRIEGLTTEQFRKLRSLFSYTTDPNSAYFSGGIVRWKFMIDVKGNFPTGLLSLLYKFLTKQKILIDKTISNRGSQPNHEKLLFKFQSLVRPYKWQEEAADAAKIHGRGGIVASTGSGKSLVIALIAARLNVRTLVVVPTLEIKKQLSESLLELFGSNSNIIVQNIDNALLRNYKDFDCLIIDECHHVASKTYQKLNKTVWNGIYHRFFLTATYFRNQENERLLFKGIAGDIIYELSYRRAVKEGYIVPVEAYYVDVPKLVPAISKVKIYDLYNVVYSKLIVNNGVRNKIIAEILKNLKENNVHTLCLVKEIRHGVLLEELTDISFVNGQDPDSREYIKEFNSGLKKALIGTTNILGEGIDTKPAEYVIIAGLGKATSAIMQQIGRGVRKYPGKESCKVILFRDESHKYTLRHFKEQCKILKERFGVIPTKLEV